MRILMFSSDNTIFSKNSDAHARMKDYAHIFGELHVIGIAEKSVHTQFLSELFLHPVCGTNRLATLFYMFFRARSLCRSIQFDIITVQAPDEIGCVGFLISRLFTIPLQIQIHTDIFSPWYRRASWKEWIRYWCARFLIPKADGVRAVSERIRRSLMSYFPFLISKKIIVLPVYTDISRFLTALPDPAITERFKNYDFKMIAVGRFVDKEKNFSMLITVMRDFVKICPDALLAIVGDGSDRRKYELQITSYGLHNNIILENWRDDLSSFYKSFDLFLQSSNYEGWGRAVIEAMAAGLPVIMTDVGLAGEIIKNEINGIVVPVGDKNALVSACGVLYRNKEMRDHLAFSGHETVIGAMRTKKDEYLNRYKESLMRCMH